MTPCTHIATALCRLVACFLAILVTTAEATAQSETPMDELETDAFFYDLPDSARQMLWHNGVVCSLGLDVAVGNGRHNYAANVEVGLRLSTPRLTGGIGLAPGSRSHTQDPASGVVISGPEGNVNVSHRIDVSKFAMPAYIFLQWEALRRKASPTLVARGGAVIAQDYDNGAYAHVHAGCRVALERTTVQPYVGLTWDAASSHSPMVAFGLAVGF